LESGKPLEWGEGLLGKKLQYLSTVFNKKQQNIAKMSKTGQDLMILCDIVLFPLTESPCYQHAEMATGRSEVLNQLLKATSPP